MDYEQVHDRGTDRCPKCRKGDMIALAQLDIPTPEVGTELECLVCGKNKSWGIFHPRTGVSVCVECRDKARIDR